MHGARCPLIRPETLAALQKSVEALLAGRAGECLAAGGRAGGTRATAAMHEDAPARAARLMRTQLTLAVDPRIRSAYLGLDRPRPEGTS